MGDELQKQKFVLLFNKFTALVQLFTANRPLCMHEVTLLEKRCTDFAFWFPEAFPSHTLPPKHHILVCHMHTFARDMEEMGYSVGQINEQCIESFHTIMNKNERRFASAGKDMKKRMLLIARATCMRVSEPCLPKTRLCGSCKKPLKAELGHSHTNCKRDR